MTLYKHYIALYYLYYHNKINILFKLKLHINLITLYYNIFKSSLHFLYSLSNFY